MTDHAPRRPQLAVGRRVRVPGPEAGWADLHAFAQTYDATFHLSSSMGTVATVAYRPVFEATSAGAVLGPRLGVDLLRAALSFQARSDTMSGADGFSSPEVETLYRAVCAELRHRTNGWVDDSRPH